jgi:hypothetical protein
MNRRRMVLQRGERGREIDRAGRAH